MLGKDVALHAHDIGDGPGRRLAVAAEPAVQNYEIDGRRRQMVLVAQTSRASA